MVFIECCILYIIISFTTAQHVTNNIDHFCETTVEGTTDDGESYFETTFVCCPGYTQDTIGKCMPICEDQCIYGFCKAPNVCECNKGYQMIKNKCVPICKIKCINGYCSRPGICGCAKGFELAGNNSTLCIPICKPKCSEFSICVKSKLSRLNTCNCFSGYVKNNKNGQCLPVCKNICTNGFCGAPDMCKCFKGFELDKKNSTNCLPKCEQGCPTFSSCVAPNKCECNNNYNLNKLTGQCEPICQDQVKNSICIAPDVWKCIENYRHDLIIDECVLESCICNNANGYCIEHEYKCECYEGFTRNSSTGQCESNCEPNCENSICVANNVCQCLDGYHKTQVNNICEKNDLCSGLPCDNGECLLTGECKCKPGFTKSLSYYGQLQCDKVTTFIGKVMTTILCVPLALACVLVIVYVIAKKKTYHVEEEERELQLLSAMH